MNYAIAKIIQINEFSIVFDKKIALQLKNGIIARDLTGENFKQKNDFDWIQQLEFCYYLIKNI